MHMAAILMVWLSPNMAPADDAVIFGHVVANKEFPKTKQNNRMRSFQASWLKTYPWLVYSESEDGGYC